MLHGYSILIGAIDVEKIDSFEAKLLAGRKNDRGLGILAEAQIMAAKRGFNVEGRRLGPERN